MLLGWQPILKALTILWFFGIVKAIQKKEIRSWQIFKMKLIVGLNHQTKEWLLLRLISTISTNISTKLSSSNKSFVGWLIVGVVFQNCHKLLECPNLLLVDSLTPLHCLAELL